MSASVYLDYNATSKVRPQAADAVARALTLGGNASSVHAAGRAARIVVEDAREAVAALARAAAPDVIFTSGGAEANTLAVFSAARRSRRLMIGATEHPSVTNAAEATGLPIDVWPVDSRGVADLDWLEARLKAWTAADGRPFAALMLANNETGVIQPVAQAARMLHDAGGWLHVDAVQGAGKLQPAEPLFGADTLAMSGHKLGGPQGSGALVVRPEIEIARLIHGGGHERGRRGGTENVPGIAGFGAAARAVMADHGPDQSAWRDAAAARLVREAGAVVLGEGAERLHNTLCVATPGFPSHLQVMALDLTGVMISAGSACSSGKVKPSPVVAAMGRPDLGTCSIRASGGWATTEEDWNRFADAWLAAHARHARRREVA